jgi:flavodoxin I
MKALVIYDSVYGNTEKIARAIAGAISRSGEVTVVRAGEVNPAELKSIDLLIVGSPTQGGRPTPAVKEFLSRIPANSLKNVSVTSFDTRLKTTLVKLFGWAASRIENSLTAKGGLEAALPEGFFVEGTKGPLKEGELERAAVWAKGLLEKKK